jgi:hypothetical protein
VKHFKNFRLQKGKRYSTKLAKTAQTLGILNNALKQTLVEKVAGIKIYNALALAILLDGFEIWTLGEKDKND